MMALFRVRRMSAAFSISPWASVRAALQSIMGALVRSRRAFTAAADTALGSIPEGIGSYSFYETVQHRAVRRAGPTARTHRELWPRRQRGLGWAQRLTAS